MSLPSRRRRLEILKAAIASNERPISALSISPEDPTSREKVDACKLLVDDGLLVEIGHRNYVDIGAPLPNTDDGRFIRQEWLYRVTAAGQDVALHPIKKWTRNILANIPTIVVAVVTSVLAAAALSLLRLN